MAIFSSTDPELASGFRFMQLIYADMVNQIHVPYGYRLLDYAKDVSDFIDREYLEGTSISSITWRLIANTILSSPGPSSEHLSWAIPLYYHNMATKDSVWFKAFMELDHVIQLLPLA